MRWLGGESITDCDGHELTGAVLVKNRETWHAVAKGLPGVRQKLSTRI